MIVELGDRHLDDLLTIADPLVVTDLPTLLWSPHGHHEAVEALLPLAQAVLLDSVDEPVWREAIDRACTLVRAGLRRRPRVAALDPVARARRGDLRPAGAALRSCERSRASRSATTPTRRSRAMLLLGWLASRLGWRAEPAERRRGCAERHGPRDRRPGGRAASGGRPRAAGARPGGPQLRDRLRLELRLDRGPGGLRAQQRDAAGAGARMDDPRRLARRGGHPRRGHPPGAAARPHLPARAAGRRRRCCP